MVKLHNIVHLNEYFSLFFVASVPPQPDESVCTLDAFCWSAEAPAALIGRTGRSRALIGCRRQTPTADWPAAPAAALTVLMLR